MGEAKRRFAAGVGNPRPGNSRLRTMEHLTLNTGHTRASPRGEVAQRTVDMLLPMVDAGQGVFPGLGLALDFAWPYAAPAAPDGLYWAKGDPGGRARGAAFFQIAPELGISRMPYVMCFACWDTALSVSTWRHCLLGYEAVSDTLRTFGIWRPPLAPPRTPWLALYFTPHMLHLDQGVIGMLGDMERCVFWSLLDAE